MMETELTIMISNESSLNVIGIDSLGFLLATDLQSSYNSLLDENNLLSLLEKTMEEEKQLCGYSQIESIKEVEPYLSSLKNVSEIMILKDDQRKEENYELIRSFLLNNKELNDKRIFIANGISLSDTKKIDLLFKYFDGFDNVYITLEGETTAITLRKLKEIIKKIDSIVLRVNKSGFSVFEKIMYAYDLVRNREYKKASNEENMAVSRELSYVLFDDKIVCLGFANIYNVVLQKLGVNSEVCYLRPKDDSGVGHARNVMYVKDKKYDIDGVFFSDPTFDSKKKNNNFLNGYRHFCKNLSFFGDEKYVNDYDWLFDDFECYVNEYIEKGILGVSLENLKKINKYVMSFNHLSLLIDGKRTLEFPDAKITKAEFENKVDKYRKLFTSSISAEKFLKALEVVRKEEYLIDSQKYPYGCNAFFLAAYNSKFEFEHLTKEERLLLAIFGETNNSASTVLKKFRSYVDETSYGKESEQIRLVNVLKNIKQKKNKA